MRRISAAPLAFAAILAVLSATVSCGDSTTTGPQKVKTWRWGPLATGSGNNCGETDLLVGDTLPDGPVGARFEECPPPGSTAEMLCPTNVAVQLMYQGDTFIGSGTRQYAGASFGTYSFFARSINDSNLWIVGTATFSLWQCWIMSRGATGTTSDFAVTGSGYGT